MFDIWETLVNYWVFFQFKNVIKLYFNFIDTLDFFSFELQGIELQWMCCFKTFELK